MNEKKILEQDIAYIHIYFIRSRYTDITFLKGDKYSRSLAVVRENCFCISFKDFSCRGQTDLASLTVEKLDA